MFLPRRVIRLALLVPPDPRGGIQVCGRLGHVLNALRIAR